MGVIGEPFAPGRFTGRSHNLTATRNEEPGR